MTTAILNTLREVSDYLRDRLDYDMRGDPPTLIGNEEAHLYGEVQEAIKELERAGERDRGGWTKQDVAEFVDSLHDAIGDGVEWEYPGQLIRDVTAMRERERTLVEALKDARDTLGVLLACFHTGIRIGSTQEVMETITRCSAALAAYGEKP